jgi:hypothetical protein
MALSGGLNRERAGMALSSRRTVAASRLKTKFGTQSILLLLIVFSRQKAMAQSTQSQWWPEFETYINLDSQFRLRYMVSAATDASTFRSSETGPTLDITLKPILRAGVQRNDEATRKYLTFGIGYRYLTNSNKASENRGILELTPRFYLPWKVLASDRSRFDLRWTSGNFLWRYRNRLTFERTLKVKSFRFTPYAREEIFYDSRSSIWNRFTYSFGATVPVHRRFDIRLYYQRVNTRRSFPSSVNALGLTVSLYFRQ